MGPVESQEHAPPGPPWESARAVVGSGSDLESPRRKPHSGCLSRLSEAIIRRCLGCREAWGQAALRPRAGTGADRSHGKSQV